jgi:PPP family 3-phenylpropionic acid transporter
VTADDPTHAVHEGEPRRRVGGATPIIVYYLAAFAALGAYLPFFPRWLEARGLAGVEMGAVASAIPIMGVVGPPLFGLAADALGVRRGLLRFAAVGALLSIGVVTAAATLPAAPAFGAVFAAMLAYALFWSPLLMVADVIALEHTMTTGTSYGRIRAWGSFGFLIAAAAVGRWVDPTAKAALPIAIAAGLVAAVGATFLLPPPSASAPASFATAPMRGLRDLVGPHSADIRLFLLASFLGQLAHASYDLCFSLHLRDLGFPAHLVGVTWAFGVVAEVMLIAWSGRLLARVPARVLLVVAFSVAAIRWALLASVRSTPALFALQPLHAFSFAMMWIASQGYLRERFEASMLGTAQGAFFGTLAAGSVVGMLVWGGTYARYGGGVVFGSASIIAVAAAGVAVLFARSVRNPRL